MSDELLPQEKTAESEALLRHKRTKEAQKGVPRVPNSGWLACLETFAKWGPGSYRGWNALHRGTYVEGWGRLSDGMARGYFLDCIHKKWLIPLGTSLRHMEYGFVIWSLKNPKRYKVNPGAWVHGRPHKSCVAWEAESGFTCVCCRMGPLPSDGLDPGMPWVEERMWL